VAGTRDRILDTTAELFGRYGYTGTGLKQIVADANAAFGSVYHFFPGGKTQLAEEVVRRSGQMYLELVAAVLDAAPDLLSGVRDVFAGAAAVLRETDYVDACPIATVALEVASSNDVLRAATADVFETWVVAAADRIASGGVDAAQARALAVVIIELLEGGFLLARAARNTDALDAAGAAVVALTEAALTEAALNEAALNEATLSPRSRT
jgi:AcrR family transcriptional regulator